MKFGTKHIKIYIYTNDHPPPHCHVRRKNDETRVAIPSLMILSGPKLSKEEEILVFENLEDLCDEFDRLNPPMH